MPDMQRKKYQKITVVKSRFFPLFADESVLTTFPACFHVVHFGILNEKSRRVCVQRLTATVTI